MRKCRSSLARPVQPRPDPRSRLILARLEHAPDRLDFGTREPPGYEGG